MAAAAYGPDDASFGRLRRRWTDWWNAHYNAADTDGGGRLVLLLIVSATQRQPVGGARWRLRHPPAVGLAEVVGALPLGPPTVAELVLGLAVALLVRPVALPLG